MQYGFVLFDRPEHPEDGGYASLAGAKAERIGGPGDLAMDTLWLTNAGWSDFFKNGLGAYPHLRMDGFLRVTHIQILNELGIPSDQALAPHQVVVLSEIFNRVALIMKRDFEIEVREYPTLREEIAGRLRYAAKFGNPELHNACKIAQQTYSSCPTKAMQNSRMVAVRKNRVAHAVEVCSVPLPLDQFTLYSGAYLGEAKTLVEKLCQFPEPVIANISIKSIDNDMVDIIAFGSVPTRNRRQAVMRDWVTQIELMMIAPYAEITVHSAYVGAGWTSLESRVSIDPLPMDYLSYSYGLVAENFRLAHASETPTRGGAFLSPQALWLSATDRFWSFIMAAKLSATGLTVSGYGGGAVNIQGHASNFEDIIRVSHQMGMNFPLSLHQAARESEILESGGGD